MRAIAFVLLAGCAAPEAAPKSTPSAAPVAVAPAAPPESGSRERQLRSAESERWYEIALGCFNKGDFDKAKESARRAVQADPENLAARKLLDDIHSIVAGTPARTPAEHDVRVALVRTEQAQIEITKHVVDGRRYLGAKMYASALKEFETAELKIRAQPYDVAALRDLLPEIRAGIAASKP